MTHCRGTSLLWRNLWWKRASGGGKFIRESAWLKGPAPTYAWVQLGFWIWHGRGIGGGGLGDESQMHADAAWDHPGRNVCDPSMRNSQELSAGIKLICRPQAKACKHTARTARVAEIGLSLPPFLSSPLLFFKSHCCSTCLQCFGSSFSLLPFPYFHIYRSFRFPVPCCPFLSPTLSSLSFYFLFSTQPYFPVLF